MTDLDKPDAAEERWLRVRYEEAGRIERTPENALAILRGELIPKGGGIVSGPVHTHRWIDGELLLNGCQLKHDLLGPARAAAPSVPGPRAQWDSSGDEVRSYAASPEPMTGRAPVAPDVILTADEAEALGDLLWRLHLVERYFDPHRRMLEVTDLTWRELFDEPKRRLSRIGRSRRLAAPDDREGQK